MFLTLSISVLFSIESQLDIDAEVMRSSQREILSADDSVYTPDYSQAPVNRALIQKAGYLNIRKYVVYTTEFVIDATNNSGM